ncbi:MAG TPA: DUF302 domain-containing protein [Myxococcota bacterium]|nr:DUF302 domain-containing protein [Myxococcota bacterium]
MTQPAPYELIRSLPGASFEDAVGRARAALAAEGFGVLTEIDVKATLRAKLGVEFGDYLILGACNPPLAHRALGAEPAIGLLLPCNVVVRRIGDEVAVSAIDPVEMFTVVGRPDIEPIAQEVRAALARVLEAL